MLLMGARNHEAIVAEVDQNSFVLEAFLAEDSFRAAKDVWHDRKDGGFYKQLAEFQFLHMNGGDSR